MSGNSGEGTENGVRHGFTEPAHHGDERTALLGFLRRQRELVVWKLRDAPEDVLRSVFTPTGMTLPGIVRHLTNVERSWIRDVFAGQSGLTSDWSESEPDAEFRVPEEVSMAALLGDYRIEAKRCDAVVSAAASLDAPSAKHDFSLRWILLHLIEETARHLGHLDLLRENADGSVGEEPN